MNVVITVDGEAGAGKSTLTKAVASDLGWHWLSTGSMYRAVTLLCLRSGIEPSQTQAIAALLASSDIRVDEDRVTVDGDDVTAELRSEPISGSVSLFAQLTVVREKLVDIQRAWVASKAADPGLVIEGRDIGTVVIPEAPLKLYLVADPQVRGSRRPEEGAQALLNRDQIDSNRSDSPLVAAQDAVVLDTTNRSVESLVLEVRRMLGERRLLEHFTSDQPDLHTSGNSNPLEEVARVDRVDNTGARPDDTDMNRRTPRAALKSSDFQISSATRSQNITYAVVRTLIAGINRTYLGLRVDFEAPLPQGPFVLAPVHRSNVDTLVVASSTRRRLRFMGKEAVFNFPILGRLLVALGGIPLNRDVADREALRRSIEALETGEPLVIFPEGQRRSGSDIKDLHEGAAYLSLRANVPLVPVGVAGTERIWPKGAGFPRPGRSRMVVGSPLYPAEITKRSGSVARTKTVSRRSVVDLNSKLESELQRLYNLAEARLQKH